MFDLPAGSAQPALVRWIIATVVSVGGSLLACWIIARSAIAVAPSESNYPHFEFADYAKLTIIGVLVACVAWPLATLVSSRARTPFLWAAIVVVVVSLAPDLWILHLGQPLEAVSFLMVMHLALGFITYPALVFIAPQRSRAVGAVAPR